MNALSVTITSHTKQCAECKKPMSGKGLTCSAKCRKARQRRKQQAGLAFPLAFHELQVMRDTIKRGEHDSRMVDELKRLQAEIKDLLLLAGDQDALARQEMFAARARRI